MARQMLDIDKDALYNSFKVRNVHAKDISIDMGFESGWLSDNISRGKGKLAKYIVDLLECKYDIPYEEYSKKPEPTVEIPVEFEIEGDKNSAGVINVYITGFSKEAMDQLAECFYEALVRPAEWIERKSYGK